MGGITLVSDFLVFKLDDSMGIITKAHKKKMNLGGNVVPLGLGDFFFSPEDDLQQGFEPTSE